MKVYYGTWTIYLLLLVVVSRSIATTGESSPRGIRGIRGQQSHKKEVVEEDEPRGRKLGKKSTKPSETSSESGSASESESGSSSASASGSVSSDEDDQQQARTAAVTTCTDGQVIDGATTPIITGNLIIAPNADCTVTGVSITGDVELKDGASLLITNSNIGGDVVADEIDSPTSTIEITDTTIAGKIDIDDSEFMSLIIDGANIGDIDIDDTKFNDEVSIRSVVIPPKGKIKVENVDVTTSMSIALTKNPDKIEIKKSKFGALLISENEVGDELKIEDNEVGTTLDVDQNKVGDKLKVKDNDAGQHIMVTANTYKKIELKGNTPDGIVIV